MQNVDGLDQAAGAQRWRVVELHARLGRLPGCGEQASRVELGQRLRVRRTLAGTRVAEITPDGDAVPADGQVARFLRRGRRELRGADTPQGVLR